MMTDPQTLHEYYSFALSLAHRAGVLISTHYNEKKLISVKSNILDIVTETDQACEKMIIDAVNQSYPDHLFIAEESHSTPGVYDITDAVTWIVDPIDGTNNFVHAMPFVCVSIGIMINKKMMIGIVHNPIMKETFHAIKGEGAFITTYHNTSINTIPITPSPITALNQSAVITELGYDRSSAGISLQLDKLRALTVDHSLQSLRSYGSCALNMCFVAMGRCEAYYEGVDQFIGPKPWDMAAAMLIVREAGGVVIDPLGGELDLCKGRVLAANHQTMGEKISNILQEVQQRHTSTR